ncbi:hypothetical protein [Amycolatopsis sp. cmx-11-51]
MSGDSGWSQGLALGTYWPLAGVAKATFGTSDVAKVAFATQGAAALDV